MEYFLTHARLIRAQGRVFEPVSRERYVDDMRTVGLTFFYNTELKNYCRLAKSELAVAAVKFCALRTALLVLTCITWRSKIPTSVKKR